MRKQKTAEPPRPFCTTCAKPEATHKLSVTVEELCLDRAAGPASRLYWTPKYYSGSRIEAVLCASCCSQHVQVNVSASAILKKEATR
jgi:hypothetical protein